mgnify:CR=1 FL=1
MELLGFYQLVIFFGAILAFCLWEFVAASRALARTRAQSAAKKTPERDDTQTAA